jgi:hypothetical protein
LAALACVWYHVAPYCSVAEMLMMSAVGARRSRLGPAVALQRVEGGARHVEYAARVNVHHGAKAIRGERLGRHEKIACRTIDEHVEPARRADGRRDRRGDRIALAHVADAVPRVDALGAQRR